MADTFAGIAAAASQSKDHQVAAMARDLLRLIAALRAAGVAV